MFLRELNLKQTVVAFSRYKTDFAWGKHALLSPFCMGSASEGTLSMNVYAANHSMAQANSACPRLPVTIILYAKQRWRNIFGLTMNT